MFSETLKSADSAISGLRRGMTSKGKVAEMEASKTPSGRSDQLTEMVPLGVGMLAFAQVTV